MYGMLSRAPSQPLSLLHIHSSLNSPSNQGSSKGPCKSWESVASEPTSVLDLRSPSPNSRTLSSLSGSVEVKAEAVSSSSSFEECEGDPLHQKREFSEHGLHMVEVEADELQKVYQQMGCKILAADSRRGISPSPSLAWSVKELSQATCTSQVDDPFVRSLKKEHQYKNLRAGSGGDNIPVKSLPFYSSEGIRLPVKKDDAGQWDLAESTVQSIKARAFQRFSGDISSQLIHPRLGIGHAQDAKGDAPVWHSNTGAGTGVIVEGNGEWKCTESGSNKTLDEWLDDLHSVPDAAGGFKRGQSGMDELESMLFKPASPLGDNSLMKWLLADDEQSQANRDDSTEAAMRLNESWNPPVQAQLQSIHSPVSSLPQLQGINSSVGSVSQPYNPSHCSTSASPPLESCSVHCQDPTVNPPSLDALSSATNLVAFATDHSSQVLQTPNLPYPTGNQIGGFPSPSNIDVGPVENNPIQQQFQTSIFGHGSTTYDPLQASFRRPLGADNTPDEAFSFDMAALPVSQIQRQFLSGQSSLSSQVPNFNSSGIEAMLPQQLGQQLLMQRLSGQQKPAATMPGWLPNQKRPAPDNVPHFRFAKELEGIHQNLQPEIPRTWSNNDSTRENFIPSRQFNNQQEPAHKLARLGDGRRVFLNTGGELHHLQGQPHWQGASRDEGLAHVNQLLQAVEAIDASNIALAQSILARLNQYQFSKSKHIQRVAFYFKEALEARLIGAGSRHGALTPLDMFQKVEAYKSFCEISPLYKFAHFTANQAILEAVNGEEMIHLIDFEVGYGSQWASFFRDIAMKPGNSPRLRMTLVGDDSSQLQFAGESLYQFAEQLNIQLEYQVVISSLESLTTSMLHIRDGETVYVNLVFSLHKMLGESSSPIDAILKLLKEISPKVVTLVERELDANVSFLQRRFVEALQYYACLCDSLQAGSTVHDTVLLIEKTLFAPEIMNIVACEGAERIERHEKFLHWKQHLQIAGFSLIPVSEASEMQAEYLTRRSSIGGGYQIGKSDGVLLLGWQGKVLATASIWGC